MTIPISIEALAMLVLTSILGLIGWLLLRLYTLWSDRVMEHEEVLKGIPDRYATKTELAALGKSIEDRLDDIKDAIQEGNGVTKILLQSLIKTEVDIGKGVRPD